MTASAIETPRPWVMREILVTLRAIFVTEILLSASVWRLMALPTQRRILDALHEGVRLMATRARHVFATMTVLFCHGRVAAGAGRRLRLHLVRGVRGVAGDAGPPRSTLRRVVVVRIRVTPSASACRSMLNIVRAVAVRARTVFGDYFRAERFMTSVAARTHGGPGSVEIVVLVASGTAFVTTREGRATRNDRRLFPMTTHARAAHVLGALVSAMTVEALFMTSASVC